MTREEFIEALDGSSSDPRRSYVLIWDEMQSQIPLMPKEPKWRVVQFQHSGGGYSVDSGEELVGTFSKAFFGARAQATAQAVCDLLNQMEEEG